MTKRCLPLAIVLVTTLASAPSARAEWTYVVPTDRIAASSLVFIGRVEHVMQQSVGPQRLHVAEVTVTEVIVGTLAGPVVVVQTVDPASLQCPPNDGLLHTTGQIFLWSFYDNKPPLRFSSTDGPLVDLRDAKVVRMLATEIEDQSKTSSKWKPEGKRRIAAVLTAMRRFEGQDSNARDSR